MTAQTPDSERRGAERRERRVEMARALARDLDRDKGQVSRDLGLLAEHGVVTFDTDGRSKRPRLPQEHVVIEPVV